MMIRKILGTLFSYDEGENDPVALSQVVVESFIKGVKEYQVLKPIKGIGNQGIMSTVDANRYVISYIFTYRDLDVEISSIFSDPESTEDKVKYYVSVEDERLPIFFIHKMTSETSIESFQAEIGNRIADEEEMWVFTDDGTVVDCKPLRETIITTSKEVVTPVLSALKELRSGGMYVW